jgi:hypothetical protein
VLRGAQASKEIQRPYGVREKRQRARRHIESVRMRGVRAESAACVEIQYASAAGRQQVSRRAWLGGYENAHRDAREVARVQQIGARRSKCGRGTSRVRSPKNDAPRKAGNDAARREPLKAGVI